MVLDKVEAELDKVKAELDKVEAVPDKVEVVQLLKVDEATQHKAEVEVKHEPVLKDGAVQMRIKEGSGMRLLQATSNEVKVKQRQVRNGSQESRIIIHGQ